MSWAVKTRQGVKTTIKERWLVSSIVKLGWEVSAMTSLFFKHRNTMRKWRIKTRTEMQATGRWNEATDSPKGWSHTMNRFLGMEIVTVSNLIKLNEALAKAVQAPEGEQTIVLDGIGEWGFNFKDFVSYIPQAVEQPKKRQWRVKTIEEFKRNPALFSQRLQLPAGWSESMKEYYGKSVVSPAVIAQLEQGNIDIKMDGWAFNRDNFTPLPLPTLSAVQEMAAPRASDRDTTVLTPDPKNIAGITIWRVKTLEEFEKEGKKQGTAFNSEGLMDYLYGRIIPKEFHEHCEKGGDSFFIPNTNKSSTASRWSMNTKNCVKEIVHDVGPYLLTILDPPDIDVNRVPHWGDTHAAKWAADYVRHNSGSTGKTLEELQGSLHALGATREYLKSQAHTRPQPQPLPQLVSTQKSTAEKEVKPVREREEVRIPVVEELTEVGSKTTKYSGLFDELPF